MVERRHAGKSVRRRALVEHGFGGLRARALVALAATWLVGAAVGPLCPARAASAPPAPAGLTVGDRERPLNVEGAPQFGWMPRSVRGNDVQTGYEIRVTGAGGQQVWDSGK